MSTADEILKLKTLLDAGAITQKEYEDQKAIILNDEPELKPQKESSINYSELIDTGREPCYFTGIKDVDLKMSNKLLKMISGKISCFMDLYFTDNGLAVVCPDWSNYKFDNSFIDYNDINYSIIKTNYMLIYKVKIITIHLNNVSYSNYYFDSLYIDMLMNLTNKMNKTESTKYTLTKKRFKKIVSELEKRGATLISE